MAIKAIILSKLSVGIKAIFTAITRTFKTIVEHPLPSLLVITILLWAATGYLGYRMYGNWQDALEIIEDKQQEIDQMEDEIDQAIQDALDQAEEDKEDLIDPFPDVPDFDFDHDDPTTTPTVQDYDKTVKKYESQIDEEEEDETIDNRGAPDTAEHRGDMVSGFGDNLRESLQRRADELARNNE